MFCFKKESARNVFGCMDIGLVGCPNSGKSTFFSAATLIDVPIASYPFTTIEANKGTTFARLECVHKEFGKQCNPINSKCEQGARLAPISLLDVAGLVPGSHLGKGKGNQFLNDLSRARALIHVVDISGSTDSDGKIVERCSCNPGEKIEFLEREIDYWINGILEKNWEKISKRVGCGQESIEEAIASQLGGLGVKLEEVKEIFSKHSFSAELRKWKEQEMLAFASEIRKHSKPILIAANKVDVQGAKELFEKAKKDFKQYTIVPCSAESELALRKAAKAGIISYTPGDSGFELLKEDIPEKQKSALEFIRTHVLEEFGSTGVQQAINATVFEMLEMIAVYPVEDQHKLCDSQGRVLPDVYLLKKGSTALDLAEAIHSDFVQRFVAAVDAKTGKRLGKESVLENNSVVKIQLSR